MVKYRFVFINGKVNIVCITQKLRLTINYSILVLDYIFWASQQINFDNQISKPCLYYWNNSESMQKLLFNLLYSKAIFYSYYLCYTHNNEVKSLLYYEVWIYCEYHKNNFISDNLPFSCWWTSSTLCFYQRRGCEQYLPSRSPTDTCSSCFDRATRSECLSAIFRSS